MNEIRLDCTKASCLGPFSFQSKLLLLSPAQSDGQIGGKAIRRWLLDCKFCREVSTFQMCLQPTIKVRAELASSEQTMIDLDVTSKKK